MLCCKPPPPGHPQNATPSKCCPEIHARVYTCFHAHVAFRASGRSPRPHGACGGSCTPPGAPWLSASQFGDPQEWGGFLLVSPLPKILLSKPPHSTLASEGGAWHSSPGTGRALLKEPEPTPFGLQGEPPKHREKNTKMTRSGAKVFKNIPR